MPELAGAAFHTGPLPVRLDGVTLHLGPLTAAAWLRVLPWQDWELSVLGCLQERSHERAMDLLGDGTWARSDADRLARTALAEAAGRPWWEAQRLAHLALQKSVLGPVLARGVDPERLTLAAFLAVVEHTVMSGLDEMKAAQMEAEIMMPPPEEIPDAPEEDLSVTVQRMRGLPGVRIG